MKVLLILLFSVFAFGVPEVQVSGLSSEETQELVASASSSTSQKKKRQLPAQNVRGCVLKYTAFSLPYVLSPAPGLAPRKTLFLRLRVLRL